MENKLKSHVAKQKTNSKPMWLHMENNFIAHGAKHGKTI